MPIKSFALPLLLAVLAAAPGPVALADPPGTALVPRYAVAGTNPNGTTYQGTATLQYAPNTDRYTVTWRIGQETYRGTGRFAEHEGAFEVTYQGGIAYYTVEPGGRLSGEWGKDLMSLTGREVWTPQR